MIATWLTPLLFHVRCFFISFFFSIPIGPANLEVFPNAVKKHYGPALNVVLVAAVSAYLF